MNNRSQLYYAMFETDTHLAYHVSRNKEDVIKRNAMSSMIPLDSDILEQCRSDWEQEVKLYESIKVDTVPQHLDEITKKEFNGTPTNRDDDYEFFNGEFG